MNNAKTFFEDYNELLHNEFDFMKKHWLGMSIVTVGVFGIELAVTYRDEIKACVKHIYSKVKKNNEEKVSED